MNIKLNNGWISALPAIDDNITVLLGPEAYDAPLSRRRPPFVGRVAEIDLSAQTITVGSRQPKGSLRPPILSLAPGAGTKFHVSNYHHFIDDIEATRRDSGLFEHRSDVLGFRVAAPWPGPIRRLLWRIMGVRIDREKCCACDRLAKKITAAGHGLCDDHEWLWEAALQGRELRKYLEMNVRGRAKKREKE